MRYRMNTLMTNAELASRYRNILIVLSREVLMKRDISKSMRIAAELEPNAGRKSGLYCKANSSSKYAFLMSSILNKNKSALHHYFKTSDLEEVADCDVMWTSDKQSNDT